MNGTRARNSCLVVPLLAAFPFAGSFAAGDASFPAKFTPLELEHWQTVRAEGENASYVPNNLRAYLKKHAENLAVAPREEIAHFDRQRRLQIALRAQARPASTARIAFLGDLLWIRANWDGFLQEPVREHLNRHDFVFANLETAVSRSSSVPYFNPITTVFNSRPEIVTRFSRDTGESAFSALSIANNHALDYGERGLTETMDFLKALKIPFSGARRAALKEPRHVVVEKKGLRIGFYAATYGVNRNKTVKSPGLIVQAVPGLAPEGSPRYDLGEIGSALKAMTEDKVDLKIISLHWGHEYEFYPTPRQMMIAREIVAMGADILLGGHSHVPQPAEICFVNGYQKRLSGLPALSGAGSCLISDASGTPRKALVIYSLGNFATYMFGFFHETGAIQGLAVSKTGGRVDWDLEEPVLVHNVKPLSVFGGAETHLASDYLGRDCLSMWGCRAGDLKKLDWLKAHLAVTAPPKGSMR